MLHRFATLLALSGAVLACSNPLPFGPGRVNVKLEDVAVEAVEHTAIFPEAASAPMREPRPVIRFNLSSQTDLLEYFKDWDRQIQVRCSVEGSANGRSYRGFATRPFPDSRNKETLRSPAAPKSGSHLYTVYAFVDLVAEDDEYERGRPATTLSLKTDHFEVLNCHLLGVTIGPALLPRSNDFILGAKRFQELYRQARFE